MDTENFVITGGRVVAADGMLDPGWLRISAGKIAELGTGPPPEGAPTDVSGCLVVPGFIDTHCHGGGGGSFSSEDNAEGLRAIATHRRHGTTTQVASLVSDHVRTMTGQLAMLSELVTDGELAGIHLEGPFIAEARCGAHDPATLREPDDATVGALLAAGNGNINMVTLAPELAGGTRAVHQVVDAGITAAIGHTDATEEQIRPAVDAGATVATHLFNQMRPLHHREPGAVGSLLADERVTVELIADLVHVHPTVLRLAASHAGAERTVLVTDAMSATDAPDGRYRLGKLDVDVHDDIATLAESGVLAGSTLTMDAAFRNLVTTTGLDIRDAVSACSTKPAALLGIGERTGEIRVGLAADLVILDKDLYPRMVLRNGEWID